MTKNSKKNEEVVSIETTTVDPIIQEADKLTTKSAKIRFLHSSGWDRSKIAKHMNIKYQHVRNVLITPIKTAKA